MYVICIPTSNIEVFGPKGSSLYAMISHIVECCSHDTSVDGKGTSILLDQKLCYQMFVSIYVSVCVCVIIVIMHGMSNIKFQKVLLVWPHIRWRNKTYIKNFSAEQLLAHRMWFSVFCVYCI